MLPAWLPAIVSVLLVSAISLVGIFFFSMSESLIRRLLFVFVSFSTGVMFGDVFLHIVPEMAQKGTFQHDLLYVLLGIIVCFCIEKFIHWQHCHVLPSKDHVHPVGTMTLVADTIHNFVDGTIIAGSFLVSYELGVATTIAVALHEIPQEISRFALLIYSGFSRIHALFFNCLSALSSLLGAMIVLTVSHTFPNLSDVLLAFAAGNFLYIAGTDLLPELHKDTHAGRAVLQLVLIVLGIGVMYGLKSME